jgi:oligosaccharide repeat unit polymerase
MTALLVIYALVGGRTNLLYSSIHFAIIILSLLHISRACRFDLGVSFSLFALFFFGVLPLFEYKLGIAYNGTSLPRDSSYLTAAALCLLSSICFYAGYGLKRSRSRNDARLGALHYISRRHQQMALIASALSVAASAIFIATYYGFSINNIIFRGYGEEIATTAIGYSLANFFFRPLLFNVIFLILLERAHRGCRKGLIECFLLGVLFFFVSPIGIPRSLAGALYIPLLTLVFLPRQNSKYGVASLVIFGVVLVAPVFDIFRLFRQGDALDLAANFNVGYLFAGHFDAFYNLCQVIETRFSSAGLQIIGALLFWIPRDIWPHKPVGTSFDFAQYAGLREGNVSFPLTAELYVDYGLMGIILGMFLLGIIYRSLDGVFSERRDPSSFRSYVFTIAHQELAILGIYLLRGSLLGSFSFTMGVASTFFVLLAIHGFLRRWASPTSRVRCEVAGG